MSTIIENKSTYKNYFSLSEYRSPNNLRASKFHFPIMMSWPMNPTMHSNQFPNSKFVLVRIARLGQSSLLGFSTNSCLHDPRLQGRKSLWML